MLVMRRGECAVVMLVFISEGNVGGCENMRMCVL